jgi:hypothetical protein
MNKGIDILFHDLESKEDDVRFTAFTTLIKITDEKVEWFDERYIDLVNKLDNENSYQRSIGIMLLCNLAKSDSTDTFENLLPKIKKHISDEKFITSRQCIQNIWKIAICKEREKTNIVTALTEYFVKCKTINHSNLLRQDIIGALINISNYYKDETLSKKVDKLIESEEDLKNKKKLKILAKK